MEDENAKQILRKYLPEKTLLAEPETLGEVTEDQLALAKEFLETVKPILETRKKASRSMDDIIYLMSQVIVKLDEVIELKNANAKAEAEVLKMLKRELSQ